MGLDRKGGHASSERDRMEGLRILKLSFLGRTVGEPRLGGVFFYTPGITLRVDGTSLMLRAMPGAHQSGFNLPVDSVPPGSQSR